MAKYNFYYIYFIPDNKILMETIIMARNKKEAIKKLCGDDIEIILKIFKINENPLFIGSQDN